MTEGKNYQILKMKRKKMISPVVYTLLFSQDCSGLVPISSGHRERDGYSLDRSPVHHMPAHRQAGQKTKQKYACTHTKKPKGKLERPNNIKVLFFWLWEEVEISGENPRVRTWK